MATFNIRHGVGLDNVLDLERTAAAVEATGAEVVGLQEVDVHFGARSNFVDQGSWLAGRLGMYVVFGPNLDLDPPIPGAPRRRYGNAILSAHRIEQWSNILLPRPEGREQRGLLEAHVTVRSLPVRVYCTHLQRRSQVERLAQVGAVRDILAGVDEPVVVLGDMNATPGSLEIAILTEDLVDAWVTAGVGDGFTIDAATPHARIDYVMSSDDLTASTAAVVTANASDHLPVVVDLELWGAGIVR